MKSVIDWIETEKGIVIGTILDTGPSMNQLIEEIKNMPVDIPNYKYKDCTNQVHIKYPEHFSRDEEFREELEKVLTGIGPWVMKQANDFTGVVLIYEPKNEQKV